MASTGSAGGLRDTGPIFVLLALSTDLSLPVEETELFDSLKLDKHGKTGSNGYLPGHIDTSTFLQAEAFEIPLHDRTAGMLRLSLDLSRRTHDTPKTGLMLQGLYCHGEIATVLLLP